MIGIILVAALFPSVLGAAQERATPVERESLHKVVLKNDYVEVMRLTLPPGQSTTMHTHSRNRASVILSESTVKQEVPGNATELLIARAGTVTVQEFGKQPFTHRISNAGNAKFDVIDIELLKRPEGPTVGPIATPAAENASFRVYRWALAAGASTPEHTHSRPYVIIAVSAMQLLMKAPEGGSMEYPIKAGDLHWIDVQVTHTLTNNGKESGVVLEIELK